MPCGGIYPVLPFEGECFYCGKSGKLDHFCEEWDTGLHIECIEPFLKTDEGQIIFQHKHEITLMINGTYKFLVKEGELKQIITK